MTQAIAATPRIPSSDAVHRGWALHLAIAAILAAGAVAVTWPVWVGIFRYALRNEEQSHSFMALPVAAWLVWVRRARLKGVRPEWALTGPLVMAAGWLVSAAGFRNGIELALHGGALLVVLGAVYTALGREVFRRVLPAVGAMALVLPVPGRLRTAVAGPLQEWSAQITHFILDLCGVPAMRSGNVLTINGVEVGIAEACNGMRMVSALAVIAYAFVFSVRLRPAARLAILAISPLIALAVNVIRLTPSALFYGYAEHETAELFHDASGWVVLLLAILLLTGLVAFLRWLEVPIDEKNSKGTGGARVVSSTTTRASAIPWVAPAGATCVLAAMLALGGMDARRPQGVDAYHARVKATIDAIPYQIGKTVGLDGQVSSGIVRILKPNAVLERRYENPDPAAKGSFGLVIVHCSDVRDLEGHYPPSCYPAHGWTPVDRPQGQELKVGTQSTPMRLYGYKRRTELGETSVRVVSFFVLPGPKGDVVDSMNDLLSAMRSTTAAGLGAAHVLVSFAGNVDDDALKLMLGDVLEHLEPTIRTVGGGVGGE